jgi:glycosyltransferase involved in cell wall biosynthesis
VVEALADGRYGLVHLCSPGPAGVMAALTGRTMVLPMAGSYHTELSAYAELRSGDPALAAHMTAALSLFYGQCSIVLSPSAAADARLLELGIEPARLGRWDRGVDASRFSPSLRDPASLGLDGVNPSVNVLYAGRLTTEKGIALLAETFLAAHARDPRLHLFVAGGGPEEGLLRALLGPRVTFLGWLEGEALAAAYASADIFLFCSQTDTFGQVLLEAQASGLPVIAVRAGGPAELIDDGRSGLLCPPSAETLADAVTWLAGSEAARRRLAAGGLAAARERSWDAALERLATGWHRARQAPARRTA